MLKIDNDHDFFVGCHLLHSHCVCGLPVLGVIVSVLSIHRLPACMEEFIFSSNYLD